MARVFAALTKFFLGERSLSYEHRQIILVTSSALVLTLTAVIVNILTDQPIIMTLLCIAGLPLLAWLRWFLPRMRKLQWAVSIPAGLGILLGVAGWITSQGIYGSAPYVFYLTLSWLLAIRDYRSHGYIVIAILGIVVILIVLQMRYPQSIEPYPSIHAQTADLIIGATATLIFQAMFISILRRQFQQEQLLLQEKNSELVALTEELREQRNKAHAALSARSNFVAAMSHELRTPLTSVIAGTRLLRRKDMPADAVDIMRLIESSAYSLLRQIDDILTLQADEANTISILSNEFDLQQLLAEIEKQGMRLAEPNHLQFTVSADENLPHQASSDRERILQVLLNLISNACKYTNKGSVKLFASFDGTNLVFTVRDTGSGIEKEIQDQLFKPFVRAAEARRQARGIGLGLSVCAAIAERLGGKVSLVSTGKQGSEFSFIIPAKQQAAGEQEPAPQFSQINLSGKKILIAEDDEVNAILLQRLLETHGIICDCVGDGKSLVERAKQNDWDLIITDIQMPDMDGFEASREIITSRGKNSETPIIALSASSYREEYENASAAGISGWVSKPFDEQSLLREIGRVLVTAKGRGKTDISDYRGSGAETVIRK